VEIVDVYPQTRERLLDLASGLDGEGAGTPVPALPGWTVKDAYAHLAGVCADVLAGNTEGGGSPPWTAKQVNDRAAHSLPEICAEWSSRSQEIDEWMRGQSGRGASFLCFDIWSHEQDIRSAVGLRGERDDERVSVLLRNAVDVFDGRIKGAGAPSAHVVTETTDRTLGDGDAGVILRTSDYELLRLFFGRRSQAQIDSFDWEGDPTPCVDHLHLFVLPEADLTD
jgi:uncharacterized protein (TIGR03083 family)